MKEINLKETTDGIHPDYYKGVDNGCSLIASMSDIYGDKDCAIWCLLNAQKYIARCRRKHESPVEDIDKAIWYLEQFKTLYQP